MKMSIFPKLKIRKDRKWLLYISGHQHAIRSWGSTRYE